MSSHTNDDKIREHTFDGIEEYDKSMPNWWLFTLYATIAFAIGYWIYFHKVNLGPTQEQEFAQAMEAIEAANAVRAAESATIDDKALWAMAEQSDVVQAGQQVYASTCMPCHGAELQGGIGLALNDAEWKHGGTPLQIKAIVADGVATAGMPAWGPMLGEDKVNQVVAFILSRQAK